jgi:hypothetical protein
MFKPLDFILQTQTQQRVMELKLTKCMSNIHEGAMQREKIRARMNNNWMKITKCINKYLSLRTSSVIQFAMNFCVPLLE